MRCSAGLILSPCQLQGAGFSSPYVGQSVQTQGIVTADFDDRSPRGFFIQVKNCDSDPATSDAIFVYLGERLDVVNAGDAVLLEGTAQEYYGLTEVVSSPAQVHIFSSANPLPDAQPLDPPFDQDQARSYFERLEGMAVALEDGSVVGPTDDDDRTWLVHARHNLSHVFYDDPAGVGERICADDGGLFEIAPEAKVGDLVQDLRGVLDYRLGEYCLALTDAPLVLAGQLATPPFPAVPDGVVTINIATFNLANLFDAQDDPLTRDTVLTNTEYQRRLQKRALAIHQDLGEPDLLMIQEVENLTVTQALADRAELEAQYQILGRIPRISRGLDQAVLYKSDRWQALEFDLAQACTALIDGLGPDGNQLVDQPQNAITCDLNGDGILDGNRLFSRPPLVAHMRFCPQGCAAAGDQSDQALEFWIIANHLKSKTEDTDALAYTLPRRIQQAQFVAGLVEQIRLEDPAANLLVMGDLNDTCSSTPLAVLGQAGLSNMTMRIGRSERYTYIYQGVAQSFDHALASIDPLLAVLLIQPVHINADYPVNLMTDGATSLRSSDHDPLLLRLGLFNYSAFLPIMMH